MHHQARQRIDAVAEGTIDTLDLSGLGLTELPEEIFQLHSLRVLILRNLSLSSNQSMIDLMKKFSQPDEGLIAELQEEEEELKQELRVPRHLLTLDDRIDRLTALEVLDVSYNRLEHLPDSLGKLTNLRRLVLKENRLTHIPASLAQLPKLELLDLRQNLIQFPPAFPHLSQYEVYQSHFRQRKREALLAKDYELSAWLYGKETSYGLVL